MNETHCKRSKRKKKKKEDKPEKPRSKCMQLICALQAMLYGAATKTSISVNTTCLRQIHVNDQVAIKILPK